MARSREEEQQECEEVVAWAAGRPKVDVQRRLGQLLRENSVARGLWGPKSRSYGDGEPDAERPYVSNHTVYQRAGSENWEHDDTGAQMNYSGVEDDVMNAFAEHEGWKVGEDFQDPTKR